MRTLPPFQRFLRAAGTGLAAGPFLGAGSVLWSGDRLTAHQIGYGLVVEGIALICLLGSTLVDG